jgi:glycosyltransferase involved in cell wall biosynthesis
MLGWSLRNGTRGVVVAIGPRSGGVGDVFGGTVSALRARGWQVVEGRPDERGSALGSALALLWSLRRALRAASVVHIEFGSNDIATFWCAVVATCLGGAPVLLIHDPDQIARKPGAGLIRRSGRWSMRLAYRVCSPVLDRVLINRTLRHAGALMVMGERSREALEARAGRGVSFVPHGANAVAPGPPPSSGSYALFAGFLGPGKGVDLLLRAWARTGNGGADLVIAGGCSADHEAWVEQLKVESTQLPRPPKWLGHIGDEADFERLIEQAAIVVLPYRRSSPASGILVRAMSAGRCVIATRVEAVDGVVEDGTTGALVDVDDVDGLGRSLTSLLSDGAERDRLGAAAAARAAEVFGWDRFSDALESAYAERASRRVE